MKKLILLLFILCLFSGCARFAYENQSKATQVTMVTDADTIALAPRVEIADPETALSKIYEPLNLPDVQEADARDMSKTFSMDTTVMEEFYVRYTSGKFGLANTFIIKPKTEEDYPKVLDQLEQVKLAISRETEHFDVYNAYQISQDAQIFEQSDYVVMLMLPDQEAARKVIDTYIPKK